MSENLNAGNQPCHTFAVYERCGDGSNRPQPHVCPTCGKLRYFCGFCSHDHHEGGWDECNRLRAAAEKTTDVKEPPHAG